MSIFGTTLDGAQVEETVQTFLQRWLPTYLAQLAEDRGLPRDAFPAPRSWTFSTDFDLSETTQLPAVLVLSTGINGAPVREGDGTYRATWVVGVAVVVSAGGDKPAEATSRLAKRYGAGIRWCVMQHPSLESDLVEGVTWEDENYDDVPSEQRRSLASARLVFSIEFHHVLDAFGGPVLPDDPPPDPTTPYPDWPTVADADHVHIDVKETP